MLSHEVIIKQNDIPNGWSLEAADFVNKLLARKPQKRLGSSGISELKEHAWLKDMNWDQIYKMEFPSPFIPKVYY